MPYLIRPIRGLSLRAKVFFLFAGAALLIVVPALLLIANAVEQRAYASATEALNGAREALDSWNARPEDPAGAVQRLAELDSVVDALSARRRHTLERVIRTRLGGDQVVLAADSSLRPLLPGPGVELEALRAAAGQGTVVAMPRSGPPLRLTVARVIRDTARFEQQGEDSARVETGRDTVTLGFLAIGTPLVAAQIRKEAPTPGTEVAVVVGDSLVSTTFADSVRPAVREFLRHGGNVQKPFIRGQTYLWSRYSIPAGGVPATVVLFRRVTDELNIANGIKQSLFGIGFAALVLALVLAAVVARIVARPTQALAEASVRLARGDYAAPLPRDSGDEIGQLARAFGEMRAAIGQREQRLRSAQAEMIHREKLAAMGRLVAQLS
ncbi:MAG TPA: HAMP domain-containing protein, partial [Longimicrobium sp.]